jgi:hypothetical protein
MGGFEFKPTGWQKLKVLLSPSDFNPTLEKNLARATALNAKLVRREIRERMRKRAYSPNAKLTVLLKNSSTPLIDTADLWNAVTDHVVNWKTAFVGVLKATRGRSQEELANLAAVLHEGINIEVTPSMRHLFLLLYEASLGKLDPAKLTGRALEIWERSKNRNFFPLGLATTHIVIPPRPFFKMVFEDKTLLGTLKANWQKAVQATFGEKS